MAIMVREEQEFFLQHKWYGRSRSRLGSNVAALFLNFSSWSGPVMVVVAVVYVYKSSPEMTDGTQWAFSLLKLLLAASLSLAGALGVEKPPASHDINPFRKATACVLQQTVGILSILLDTLALPSSVARELPVNLSKSTEGGRGRGRIEID
uniref:Uncharacterized protein n=1 Tax=Anopheles farauti TaxID=69004 RepID=A0A182R0L3_9DIPT